MTERQTWTGGLGPDCFWKRLSGDEFRNGLKGS